MKPLRGSLSQTLQLKEGLGKSTAVAVISRHFRDARRPQKTSIIQARNKVNDHHAFIYLQLQVTTIMPVV